MDTFTDIIEIIPKVLTAMPIHYNQRKMPTNNKAVETNTKQAMVKVLRFSDPEMLPIRPTKFNHEPIATTGFRAIFRGEAVVA